MVANGGEIGHFIRRSASSNSPRRSPGNSHPQDFDSLMEIPKLLQRGVSFKPQSPMRFPSPHHPNSHSIRTICQRKLLLVAIFSSLICFLFLYFFNLRRGIHISISKLHPGKKFGVVIDIGKAESRVNVFEYRDAGKLPAVALLATESRPTETFSGLSGDSYHASAPLFELLDFAKKMVPEMERPRSRVHILGTGGLMWLSARSRNELLQQFRTVLQDSEFLFRDEWARIINGRDEGVYEWVAANYAHGTLQNDPLGTVGILDMGDAYVKVSFIPEEMPHPEFLYKTELWGVTYNLYTNSFDNFAEDGTIDKRVFDPCTPRGYVAKDDKTELPGNNLATIQPAGNFSECQAAALTLLQQGQDLCLYKNCAIGTAFVPEIHGKFLATKNFYRTAKFFGLPATTSLAELVVAGKNYCGQEWVDMRNSHPEEKDDELRTYCFSAAYIVAFLHDSLGFPLHDDRVRFSDKVNNVPLEWTLGAFMMQLAEDEGIDPPSITMLEESFVRITSFLGLVAIGGVLLWFAARWRRPQTKTIYDLEKGRYITTATRGR